jgi:glycerophosphoryl diester phosphodiesterase
VKKRIKMTLLYFFLFVLIGLPIINLCIAAFLPYPDKTIIKVGHRGAGGLAPENTVAAIHTGIVQGVDYAEVDIRQTSDGEIVIMHDKTVDRTTNGKGEVNTLTYSYISSLNASRSFSSYKGIARVPLLKEVLAEINQSNAKLIIEIKNAELYPGMIDQLVHIIKETNSLKKVAVFSFDKKSVKEIHEKLPGVETGFFCVGLEYPRDSASFNSPHWISVLYFPFIVKGIHQRGSRVLTWTPDSPFFMKYLLKMNVDGIITNRPDILQSVLSENNLH